MSLAFPLKETDFSAFKIYHMFIYRPDSSQQEKGRLKLMISFSALSNLFYGMTQTSLHIKSKQFEDEFSFDSVLKLNRCFEETEPAQKSVCCQRLH